MGKETSDEQVVIVFTEHPVLGTLLIPYLAEKGPDGSLQLAEQAFHASNEAVGRMSEAERRAIDIASHYTEKYLMGVYSREKTTARFLHKLTEDPERMKNYIRPYIEKKLQEMLALIRNGSLPLYQKQERSKVLHPYHAYRVHPNDVESRFAFQADHLTFRYRLQCFYDGQPLALEHRKPVVTLTASPATLLLGMDLYFFAHIDSNRILPFTKKEEICVETGQLDKYIDNIVIPIARYHETETEGLDIVEEHPVCLPCLSVESTVYDKQTLKLRFCYGKHEFVPAPDSDMKRIIGRNADGSIFSFRRDPTAEAQAVQLLEANGLKQTGDAHFKLPADAPEQGLADWMSRHREMLQANFRITAAAGNAPYCLDDIRIEQSCDEKPDWFELRITVVIGDIRLPFTRFLKYILEEKREYPLPDGRIILLPEEWFSKYANIAALGTLTERSIRLKHSFVGAVQAALENRLPLPDNDKNDLKPIPAPDGLKATLRPYQQKGFAWMVHLRELQVGGCLADDMGLGKTLQTLTLLQYLYPPRRKEEETTATTGGEPATAPPAYTVEADGQLALFSSDADETHQPLPAPPPPKEDTPHLPATLIVVPTSLLHNWRREIRRFTTLRCTEYNSTTVVNPRQPERFFNRHQVVLTTYGVMRNNIERLRSYLFEYIVLDESQNIKNSESLTFRAAAQLQGKYRLSLTGTPIENSLRDLWAQFHFLQPDLLGTESNFQKQFVIPIRQGSPYAEKRLRQLIAPLLLRRSKSEVAPELPPLTEETICCDMTPEQETCYEQEKNSLRNVLLHTSTETGAAHSFSMLNGILRLRQLACHPCLVQPDFEGTSGKTTQIIDTFETLRSEGHKVLIFSSFVKHLEIIAAAFQQRGWKYALLTGSTTDRPSAIARFTEQTDVQAFLISLKAGGVGLNLTQADYVFIIDPWWNPAAEAQAIARAHRIGQDKQVIAYRFITQGSIEEKILLLQEEKKRLVQTFVTDSEALPALSDEEWMRLIQ